MNDRYERTGANATSYLFTGGRLLDPSRDALLDGFEVLVENDRIKEVSDRPIAAGSAIRIDLSGKTHDLLQPLPLARDGSTLMPGLIDCHVHVVAALVDIAANAMAPSSLAAMRAARILRTLLMRGFTTVRDAGAADHGLVRAIDEGLIEGPRLIISGKALSQTGGHGDSRARSDDRMTFSDRVGALCRLADGVDGVRKAAREEIKSGARFVKIMANGGVASPNDPIHALGYSRDEISAAVEEAKNAGLYVAAHLYTDEAIARAVDCGVHSLEHCNLVRPETTPRRRGGSGGGANPRDLRSARARRQGVRAQSRIRRQDRDRAQRRHGLAFNHA
jgi:imidazolonepropionase-like amidohydrolase